MACAVAPTSEVPRGLQRPPPAAPDTKGPCPSPAPLKVKLKIKIGGRVADKKGIYSQPSCPRCNLPTSPLQVLMQWLDAFGGLLSFLAVVQVPQQLPCPAARTTHCRP